MRQLSFCRKGVKRVFYVTLLSILCFNENVDAQLDFVSRFLEPSIFKVSDGMRQYIRDELPGVTHNRTDELKDTDLIFLKGMELSNKNPGSALLAISIAVLNRRDIKPSFPLFGVIKLPLPSEDSADAAARINKLPRYFFEDSPQDKFGDSDKLAHFFGSAYLTYETGSKKVPDAIGTLVEQGEVAFKLDVAEDPRDVFANRLGQLFGEALSEGRAVLPSDYLSAKYIK